MPDLPEGLEIDRDSKLDGTVAPYDAHLIVRTGRSDWPSKIEDDEGVPGVGTLKRLLGRGGKYQNPFHNILISTSDASIVSADSRSILLFPQSQTFRGTLDAMSISKNKSKGEERAERFLKHHLLPASLSDRAKEMIPEDQQQNLVRADVSEETVEAFLPRSHKQLTVLICGHGGRDQRCGILGPILKEEFSKQLKVPTPFSPMSPNPTQSSNWSVELISHVGGHKFAGNVILYFPKIQYWQYHPLAGMGVWYGRVEPRHVDGIVRETVLKGNVIRELFRGGIDGKGGILRLANVESVVSA